MSHYHAPRHGSFDPDYGCYAGAVGDPRNDDSISECCECGGSGKVPDAEDHEDLIECPWCEGAGYIDANGNPYKPENEE